jgi:uncharacterized ion transporter superfamily protein YfcC
MVGIYGSTYASTIVGNNNQMLSTEYLEGMGYRLVLFVLALALLIGFTLLYIKNNNSKVVKKEAIKKVASVKKFAPKKKVVKKAPAKKTTRTKSNAAKATKVKVVKNVDSKSKSELVWPVYLILGLVVLIVFLGSVDWAGMFGTNWFATLSEKLSEFAIGDFNIYDKIFGGIAPFGTWTDAFTRFNYYSIFLIIASIALILVYKIKWDEAFDKMIDGAKDYFKLAMLLMLASSMFVFAYYYGLLSFVNDWFLGLTEEFNVVTAGITSIVNSTLYVNYYFYSGTLLSTFMTKFTDPTLHSLMNVMVVNLYGLTMLVAPTSLLMLASLWITDIDYKSWIKFIWKFVLALFVLSFIVLTIMVL